MSQPAAAELARAAASVEPFDVTLREFRVFVHKRSATLWLHPEPSRSEALQKLQAALQAATPLCDAQRSNHGTFTPHVTVGHFDDEAAALSARDRILASGWQGIQFPVSEVVLMSRGGGGGQFEPRWRVRLGRSSAGLAMPAAHGERFALMPTEMPAFCAREASSKKEQRALRKGAPGLRHTSSATAGDHARTADATRTLSNKPAASDAACDEGQGGRRMPAVPEAEG